MLDSFTPFLDVLSYANSLPSANIHSLRHEVLEIWDNTPSDSLREEIGTFQFFDRYGTTLWNADAAMDLEISLNDYFIEEGHPIKVQINRIDIYPTLSSHRIPSLTFEMIIFDNAFSESVDPVLTKIIEDQESLESK